MTVALISDAHLISPDDDHDRRDERLFFAEAFPSFRRMVDRLNDENVDRVVVLGDLVDYYSEANREFALELLSELEMPWELTPGNHDLAVGPVSRGAESPDRDAEWARNRWAAAGVPLANRVRDIGELRLLLMDSALSEVPEGTGEWLDEHLETDRYCVLCTHVPVDTQEVVDCILEEDPTRDLDKYVQRGSPDLFDQYLSGCVDAVFSGHLHFPADTDMAGTHQYILPPCIHAEPPNPEQGTAILLDTTTPGGFQRISTSCDAE